MIWRIAFSDKDSSVTRSTMSSSACMLQLTPFNRAHSVTLVHLLQTSGEGGGRVEHYPDADSVSKITQRSIGGRQLLKWSIEVDNYSEVDWGWGGGNYSEVDWGWKGIQDFLNWYICFHGRVWSKLISATLIPP